MRVVFIGASPLVVTTARLMLKRGHEVVIVEPDRALIDSLAEELDCGFIHGDGSKPAILREVSPGSSDLLCCLSESDEANILASLVGRSLGFGRVVTKIDDVEFEHVCIELGLQDTIIPSRTIARHLADLCEGRLPLELSTMLRDEARAISFVVREDQVGQIDGLQLPDLARVICIYRQDRLLFPDADTALRAGDEVVLIVHRDHLEAATQRLGSSS
jgi:trk system potassium uptake protein TrkA